MTKRWGLPDSPGKGGKGQYELDLWRGCALVWSGVKFYSADCAGAYGLNCWNGVCFQ